MRNLIGVPEAAAMLQVRDQTVLRMSQDGRLKVAEIEYRGKRTIRRFEKSAVERLLAQSTGPLLRGRKVRESPNQSRGNAVPEDNK